MYLGLCIQALDAERFSWVFLGFLLVASVVARGAGVFLPAMMVGVCKGFKMDISF